VISLANVQNNRPLSTVVRLTEKLVRKSCSVAGIVLLGSIFTACGFLAPKGWGFTLGAAVSLAYVLAAWLIGGLYMSAVLHVGIAHRAADLNGTFVKLVVLVQNVFVVPIDPVEWVRRHRYHHAHPDGPADPNRHEGDGFLKTLSVAFFPYPCDATPASDLVLRSWPFRLVRTRSFVLFGQFTSYAPLWLLSRDWRYALLLWVCVRSFGLYVNMIQNYWCHDRRFGFRSYDTGDNSVNIKEWLPLVLSFGNSLHNNHHLRPRLARLSHRTDEFDFGFAVIRLLEAAGLARGVRAGGQARTSRGNFPVADTE
jgi:stearoyl-CoA desaturase (delta-9 desaturase)